MAALPPPAAPVFVPLPPLVPLAAPAPIAAPVLLPIPVAVPGGSMIDGMFVGLDNRLTILAHTMAVNRQADNHQAAVNRQADNHQAAVNLHQLTHQDLVTQHLLNQILGALQVLPFEDRVRHIRVANRNNDVLTPIAPAPPNWIPNCTKSVFYQMNLADINVMLNHYAVTFPVDCILPAALVLRSAKLNILAGFLSLTM
jgi:hypothetical protein